MMHHKDVQIQLVEVPGLVEGAALGKGMGPQLLSVIRNADAVAIVVDLSRDPIKQMETLLKEFERAGIKLNKRRPRVEIKRTAMGGIVINGGENIRGGHRGGSHEDAPRGADPLGRDNRQRTGDA